MRFRSVIADFQLANAIYIGATVTFYEANTAGLSTGVLATLYSLPTGSQTTNNPQTLDGEGKFTRPVYIDGAVIAEVTSSNVATHQTGAIVPRGTFKGKWIAGARYSSGDIITTPSGDDLYAVSDEMVAGASLAADVAAGKIVFVLGLALATALTARAEAAAAAADISEAAAAASALIASNAAGSVDSQAINLRFQAIEARVTVLESDDYEAEQAAYTLALIGD